MSDKYKYSERLEETLRYLNDSMSNEERYSFEREIERDPFMQEAFEGLSGVKSSDIEKDIRRVDIITGKKRKSFLFVKILAYAAGFALLFTLGYWAVQNIDFSKKKAIVTAESSENILLREPYKPASTDTTPKVDSSRILVADAGLTQSQTENNLSFQSSTANGLVSEKSAIVKEDQTKAKELIKKKLALKNAAEKTASLKAQEQVTTSEVSENSESESTFQAAPVSEVQPKSTEDIEEVENALKRPGVNAEPQPLGGSTLYKEYLENNAKYPGGLQNAKKEFVKVKFKISKVGQPFNIVVEKSPDQEFSREAIRLILDGPKWSPEIKDGIPVEGEVSIKINFKP